MSELSRLTSDPERGDPMCDWLDVTCKPENSFIGDLEDWLALKGIDCVTFKDGSTAYMIGRGLLKLNATGRFHRASASGGFIDELRVLGLWRDYVNVLGVVPHTVTRLDIAVDIYIDAPLILDALESTYSDGEFHFGRKGVRTKTILEKRERDNVASGTWYAGHRSNARVSGRVYDKQLELASKHGMLSPPLTRFELTFRKDFGASLWDVLSPTDLFYSHAGGLMKTDHIKYAKWESRGTDPWISSPVDTDLTVERARVMLRHSAEIKRYASLFARHFGSAGEDIMGKCLLEALHDATLEASEQAHGSASEA